MDFVDRSTIYTQLDNGRCVAQCFDSSSDAVHFVQQAMKSGWKSAAPIESVKCMTCY